MEGNQTQSPTPSYQLRQGNEYDGKTWQVPQMATHGETVMRALDMANSLAEQTGKTIIILRDGNTLLDVPAPK